MVSIFTIAYNESDRLKLFYDFYAQRFPFANFTLIDNESTDNTVNLAIEYGFQIEYLRTEGINWIEHTNKKNEIAKRKGWKIVVDIDELIDLNQYQLNNEINHGTTVLRVEAYEMIDSIYGVRLPEYDKIAIFNDKVEVCYHLGCHNSNLSGDIIFSRNVYKMYHYKYNDLQRIINIRRSREVSFNVINRDELIWNSSHEKGIFETYKNLKQNAIKVR